MTSPPLNCESVRTVVSRLTREEESELGLEGELDAAQSLGPEFARIAIEDQGTPQPGLVEEMLWRIRGSATPQNRIAIHCRQGLGRSPLVAPAILVRDGMTLTEAWEAIAIARGRPVPETDEQRAWLTRFAAS